jgi:hypothetical protein
MTSGTKSSKSYSNVSVGEILRNLSPSERESFLKDLPRDQQLAILYDWERTWARPEQLTPPDEWHTWLIRAGRGFGKTGVGAETVRSAFRGMFLRFFPYACQSPRTLRAGHDAPPHRFRRYAPGAIAAGWKG